MVIADNSEIWARWRNHYLNSPFESIRQKSNEIISDGIISENVFNKLRASARVVFSLKECNVRPREYGNDFCSYLRAQELHGAIALNIARWNCAIRLTERSIQSLNKDRNALLTALLSSAIVNLKKIEGGPVADMSRINLHAFHDRELLREQFQILNPSVIVACGTIDQLLWLLDLEPLHGMKCKTLKKERWVYRSSLLDCPVISFRHPSRVANVEKVMYDLRSIYSSLVSQEPCVLT
jgi:hypothetical protein